MDHSGHEGRHTATGGEGQKSRFEADMDAGMARMMQDMHSPGYTGQPDSDFLAMMIPHHEGAVAKNSNVSSILCWSGKLFGERNFPLTVQPSPSH